MTEFSQVHCSYFVLCFSVLFYIVLTYFLSWPNPDKSFVLTQPNSVIRFTVITVIQGGYFEKGPNATDVDISKLCLITFYSIQRLRLTL